MLPLCSTLRSMLLRSVLLQQLAVLPQLGAGYPTYAGSCNGPGTYHSGGGPSIPAIAAPATAEPGELVDVTLSHASTDFKGLLLKASSGADSTDPWGFQSPYPPGTQNKACPSFSAVQHSADDAKNNLVFSLQMPCSPGSVTITGFLVFASSAWNPVDSATITVAGACQTTTTPGSTEATCAGFDCSAHTNELDAAPGAITCAASECAASECCTVVPQPVLEPVPLDSNKFSKQLAPGVLMSWTVDGNVAAIDVAFSGSAWVAFGRAETAGAMVGGDVLIGQPTAGPTSGVAWYSMSSKLLSGVTRTDAPVPADSTITQIGGQTVLHISSWDVSGRPEQLLWAVGTSSTLSASGHEVTLRGGMSIDFDSGEVESSVQNKKRVALIIHGSLMMLGWGILLPFGILSAIYRSRIADGKDGIWLKYHARLQVSGALPSESHHFKLHERI